MDCINLSKLLNFSDILSLVNIFIAIGVPLYIFCKWKDQKKYEVIALSSSTILREILDLREEISRIYNYHNRDETQRIAEQREYLGKKRDFIESELKAIFSELKKLETSRNKDTIAKFQLDYESYNNKLTKFIRSLNENIVSDTFINQSEATNKLAETLSKIKFYNI